MTDGIPFGLRPWPTESSNRAPKSVAEFIARTNAEVEGGFRAISEKDLRRQIEQQQSEDALDPTAEDDDEMQESEDAEEEDTKDPNVAKMEILRSMDHAHNCAMITLDFMSLLMSKELPVQAGTTLTARLREMVGIGTLGSNKVMESNVTASRLHNDSMIGLGWALMDVDKARQTAAKLSVSMKQEISRENKYWESIVSVCESGWAICRLPNERQTLGVKFGFTEANPKFRNASLAPMRRSTEGTARLDLGKLGGVSKRLCVSIEVDGTIVGRSKLAMPIPDDAPLATHVLEARNTVFAQELWHELQMEARSLLSYGVARDNSRIVYQTPTPGRTVILELVDINSNVGFKPEPMAQDDAANAISLTLSLLLTYVHRQSEHLYSQALPPHVSRKRTIDHQDLLRPIIARDLYRKAIAECVQYVGALVKTLRNAGFPEARFTVVASPHKVKDMVSHVAKLQRIGQTQAYIAALLQPLSFRIQLVVTKNSRLTIVGRTILSPITMTMYTVYVPGPGSGTTATTNMAGSQPPNYLSTILASPSQYPNMREVRQVLCYVMAVAVSQECQDMLNREERAKAAAPDDGGAAAAAAAATQWVRCLDNTTLRRSATLAREVAFSVRDLLPAGAAAGPELAVLVRTKTNGFGTEPAARDGGAYAVLPSTEELVASGKYDALLQWTAEKAEMGSILEACQRL
ncbi:hypothetical protein TD95_001159, partial [Thielaviopsis punctulata]